MQTVKSENNNSGCQALLHHLSDHSNENSLLTAVATSNA